MSPRLGSSTSITDQWTYVQDSPPTDQRDGVRWIDSSDSNTAYLYSSAYGDWVRESRVWVQDTEPTPRVGPLDGDRWVDTSQDGRPTLVYTTTTNSWSNPINVSWAELNNKPAGTQNTSYGGGYNYDRTIGASVYLQDGAGTPTDTAQWSQDPEFPLCDSVKMEVSGTVSTQLNYLAVKDENLNVLDSRSPMSGGSKTYEFMFQQSRVREIEITGEWTGMDGGSDLSVDATPHEAAVTEHSHPITQE